MKIDQPIKKALGIPKPQVPYKGLQARKSEQVGLINMPKNGPKFINRLPMGLVKNDGLAPGSGRFHMPVSPQKIPFQGQIGQKQPKLENCADPKELMLQNQMVRNEMEKMKEQMEHMQKVI